MIYLLTYGRPEPHSFSGIWGVLNVVMPKQCFVYPSGKELFLESLTGGDKCPDGAVCAAEVHTVSAGCA